MKCNYCGKEVDESNLCGNCRRVISQMVFADILDANDYCKRVGWSAYQISYTGSGYKVNELEGF